MTDKKKIRAVVLIVLLCCFLMALVDGVWQPHYGVKSGIKIILFLTLPLIYSRWDKSLQLKELFRVDKKGILLAFCLAVPLFVLILGAYLIFKDVFDFSAITGALTGNAGITRENFVFVAIYISFVNSLLEEFFFRGFAYLGLRNIATPKFAFVFSATTFAAYHIAIMTGWFSLPLFALTMVGLVAGGAIFNLLNLKYKNIYTSWLVHMFANFAINTIGFMLFGII